MSNSWCKFASKKANESGKFDENVYWDLCAKHGGYNDPYYTLLENIDKNSKIYDDVIDKKHFNKIVNNIIDYIIDNNYLKYHKTKKGGINYERHHTIGYNFGYFSKTFDLSYEFSNEGFRSYFSNYNYFGDFKDYDGPSFSLFHGHYSSFKELFERFNDLIIQSDKDKKRKKSLLHTLIEGSLTYYKDYLGQRYITERFYEQKNLWKDLKKYNYLFKFDIRGTKYTSDWYDNVNGSGYILLNTPNIEYAKKLLLGYKSGDYKHHGSILNNYIDCHNIFNITLENIELNKENYNKYIEYKKNLPWNMKKVTQKSLYYYFEHK